MDTLYYLYCFITRFQLSHHFNCLIMDVHGHTLLFTMFHNSASIVSSWTSMDTLYYLYCFITRFHLFHRGRPWTRSLSVDVHGHVLYYLYCFITRFHLSHHGRPWTHSLLFTLLHNSVSTVSSWTSMDTLYYLYCFITRFQLSHHGRPWTHSIIYTVS